MSERPFRFGLVATPAEGASAWLATARRAEELGYATLLSPDNLHLPTPTASLAVAATATSTLRVGSYVLAAPLRTPRAAAWEAHSLSVLTGGRFELGLGTGVPAMREQAEQVGLPYRDGPGRLAQVAATIEHLRALEPDSHTPVLIAAGGPKALTLAAERADIVALAAGPLAARDAVDGLVTHLRTAAGERADRIELTMNLFVIGDEVPPWVAQFTGADAATLIAHDSLTMLRGTTSEMVDELQRRRDRFGVSYVTVYGAFAEQLAPVVERLTGR